MPGLFSRSATSVVATFATTPNDEAQAIADWKAIAKKHELKAKETATPVQVLNPAMGKGVNRAKADGANHLGNPDSFWPLEFLKFWGMRLDGVPRGCNRRNLAVGVDHTTGRPTCFIR